MSVRGRNILASEWVLHGSCIPIFFAGGIELEKFSGSVAKEFMQSHNNRQRRRLIFEDHVHV